MNTTRRQALARFAVLAAAPYAGRSLAQSFPARSVRFVVPYPPGGPLDTVARLLAQRVSALWGQPVVVENIAGAGGNIGAAAVAKATPDGHTILMGAVATHAINPSLYAAMPYDAAKDFIAVTQVASTPNVLVVNPQVPAKSVSELVAHARAKPGGLNYGSGSTGSAGHLAGELFNSLAGVRMVHVPYKGAPAAMQDLIAGRVDLMFDNLASSLTQVKAGRIRALAVTTAKRTPLAPDLPTLAESGLPGFDISTWFGIFAPAGTPRAAIDRIYSDFARSLAEAEVREKLVAMGADPVISTPEAFAAFVTAEAAKYARLVKASGAKAD